MWTSQHGLTHLNHPGTDMPTNTVVVASFDMGPVPPDRECVNTLTEIGIGLRDYAFITGLASSLGTAFPTPTVGNTGIPTTNNQAALALEKAQEALDRLNEFGSIRVRRNSTSRIPLKVGSSVIPITFAEMPSIVYEVRITLWSTDELFGEGTGGARPTWTVVSGSETLTRVMLNFIDIRTNMSFTWCCESLEETGSGSGTEGA